MKKLIIVVVIALGLLGIACGEGAGTKKSKGSVTPQSVVSTAPSTTSTTVAPTTTTTARPTTTTTAKPVTTTTRPLTTTTAPVSSGVAFANCTEAKAAGYHDIPRGAPGYSSKLDRDGDGIACES